METKILDFKQFCKTKLGHTKEKYFHMIPWEWGKSEKYEGITFVNTTTEALWKMWKELKYED